MSTPTADEKRRTRDLAICEALCLKPADVTAAGFSWKVVGDQVIIGWEGRDAGTVRHLSSISSTTQEGLYKFKAQVPFAEFAELLDFPLGTTIG